MININIPVFYTKEINEYMLFEYNNIVKEIDDNYEEHGKNNDYLANIFIEFLLKSLNIKLKDFKYLTRDYINSISYKYEFAKIISLYIYIKFVIHKNEEFEKNAIWIFNDIKEKIREELDNIEINKNNTDLLFSKINKYGNTLKLLENLILYAKHNNIIYLDNIDLKFSFKTKSYKTLNDLILLFNYFFDFCDIFCECSLIDFFNSSKNKNKKSYCLYCSEI